MTTKVPVRQTAGFPFTKPPFKSEPQTMVAGGQIIIGHDLGERPKVVQIHAVCVNANNGYTELDELEINPSSSSDATTVHRGITLVRTANNVVLGIASNAYPIMAITKLTRARFGISIADWKLVVRAYA